MKTATTAPTTTAAASPAEPPSAARPAQPPCGDRPPRAQRPAGVQVRRLTDADLARWEAYVGRHADATVFHDPAWGAAVGAAFGHRPLHLSAWRGAALVGVLPLMEVRSALAGRLLISVPYGTYGGCLADDDSACTALAQAAAHLADERKARVLDLRSARALVPDFERVEGYVGFFRELPDRPEDVGPWLPKRARAAARHARDRDGVEIRHERDQLRLVWQLYCRSMRRIASINYPWHFFEELAERFRDRCWVSVAWQGSEAICGTVSFAFRDTLMPYVLGADERVPCDGAANLLYWNIMERAVAAGLRRFDYGRSRADNPGAMGFKKNQGFEPQALEYQRYVPPGQHAPDLKPSNPRFATARRVWPRLPLRVTQGLGAWLARSLPG